MAHMMHEAPLVAESELAAIRQTSRLELAEFMTGLDEEANNSFGALGALADSDIRFNGLSSRWEDVNQQAPIDTALIYAPAREAQEALLKSVNKYRFKQNQPPLSLESLGGAGTEQSLSSVYAMLDTLATKDRRAEGASGKLKKAIRFLNDHAGTGKSFASLLPSDMGGGVLSGGLGAVFSAMEQQGLHRTEIHRVILRLPDLLAELSGVVEIYNEESEDLHRHAAKVNVYLAAVMKYILDWFLEKDFVTGVKAVVNPNRGMRKLNDRMADLEIAIQGFHKYALMLSQKRQKKLEQIGYHGLFGQSLMLQGQKSMSSTMEEMNQRLQKLETLERMAQVLMPLGNQLLTQGFSETRAIEMAQERSTPRRKKPTVTPTQVLTKFQYDPSILTTDLEALTTLQPARDRLDENRVCALNHNSQVRLWLSANHSSLLLLNGRTGAIPKSEVSFFAASMVKRLRGLMESDHDLVVLGFFAGQHREQDDPYGNPSELLLGLLSQLVEGYDGFSSDDLEDCRRTDPEDVDGILEALGRLVHALDERTILMVVVDGLRFLSEPHTAQCIAQTRRVVGGLVNIWREGPRATVKMMFASPVRSEGVEDFFEEEEILDMPRNVRPASGYRESSWQESPLDLDDDEGWP